MGQRSGVVGRARASGRRTAIIDGRGILTYGDLLSSSKEVAAQLLGDAADLAERRVAFLCQPGRGYVATLWGIWRAGGVAVPIGLSHPAAEIEYSVDTVGASQFVAEGPFIDRVAPLAAARGLPLLDLSCQWDGNATIRLPTVTSHRRALILFTSGSTGRPKGVVWTHAGIASQASMMSDAWGWTARDHILSVLPLHHIHGLVNVVTTALWCGATCEFVPRFDPDTTWARLGSGGITMFMAVPTIYVHLIKAWEAKSRNERFRLSAACRSVRLMVSGSSALPTQVLQKWQSITGHTLLERYGMTEVGMAIANPLDGERVPGSVGMPLPGVRVRLVDDSGRTVAGDASGQIEIRGPGLFLEYWRDSRATDAAFRDGWFQTGDVAARHGNYYRILGRANVDIIKTGGYKVSAVEIEQAFAAHPDVEECAVVGIPDDEWGERVAAYIVLRLPTSATAESLREWGKERLAPYKVPRVFHVVDELPRNEMGKVVKPTLRQAAESLT